MCVCVCVCVFTLHPLILNIMCVYVLVCTCTCVCVCMLVCLSVCVVSTMYYVPYIIQEFALKACIEHFNVTYYSVEGRTSSSSIATTAQVGAGVGQQQAAGGPPPSG